MHLSIHRLSLKILRKHYGPGPLDLARITAIIPVLMSEPQRGTAHLDREIEIIGSPARLQRIHPDAGHSLYRLHMQQLMDWMTMHVEMGQMAWPAMMDFYSYYDLQDEDYDTSSAYRIWHRAANHKKNRKNIAHFSPAHVLKNVQVNKEAISDIMDRVSEIVESHPDLFYTSDGTPSSRQLSKAIMYVMATDFGWNQSEIAPVFSIHRSVVSRHISSLFPPRVPIVPL